jgi:RHS repeat-associated protein
MKDPSLGERSIGILPGQYFDKETNLHYNYNREYDPSTGRYVESDLIGLRGGPMTCPLQPYQRALEKPEVCKVIPSR